MARTLQRSKAPALWVITAWILLATAVFAVVPDAAAAPPPNDNINTPLLIEGRSGTVALDTSEATRGANEPACDAWDDDSLTNSVWFEWNSPHDDAIELVVDERAGLGVWGLTDDGELEQVTC